MSAQPHRNILISALVGGLLFSSHAGVVVLLADISDSLISCWALDEASGTRNDSATSANHLTDNNTAAAGTAKLGTQSADFEASSTEYLSRASNASLQMGNIDFTICAWVNLETTGVMQIVVSKDDDAASSRDYTLSVNTSNVPLFYVNGGVGSISVNTLVPLTIGAWNFVCAWHNGASDTINIQHNDGTIASFPTGGIVPDTSSAEFRIGAREYAGFENYFDGRIDEVAIWKRLLTDAERTDLYLGGTGRSCSYVVTPPPPVRPCCGFGVF